MADSDARVLALPGRAAVFLDRDGVLNRAPIRQGVPSAPRSVAELEVLPGVNEACQALRQAGFLLVVVTNQPDVARSLVSRAHVEAINESLRHHLGLHDVRVCYHDDGDRCRCRKPSPGMIIDAAQAWSIDLSASYLVGDRWRDIEAGRQAGCRTVHVDRGYDERDVVPDHRVTSLPEAARWILGRAEASKTVSRLLDLKVKLFADGADKAGMLLASQNPLIKGFTTNPTLMRKAGVTDYRAFARDVLRAIPDRPISFEVFGDDHDEMERQAVDIAAWGSNVYVKIPVTNTKGRTSGPLVRKLSRQGVKLNVTALLTLDQVREMADCLAGGAPSCVSVFAGRMADTGRDPVPVMAAAVDVLQRHPQAELIWASPREVLNVFQADAIGCHIITLTNDLLGRLELVGKELDEYSLETVKMFFEDGRKAGFTLSEPPVSRSPHVAGPPRRRSTHL